MSCFFTLSSDRSSCTLPTHRPEEVSDGPRQCLLLQGLVRPEQDTPGGGQHRLTVSYFDLTTLVMLEAGQHMLY